MRKKRRQEHSNHERWLVSYADFITLLFAFFVVLYSSAQVDQRKVGKLAVAIQTAFQQMGVFDPSSPTPNALNEPPELLMVPAEKDAQLKALERISKQARETSSSQASDRQASYGQTSATDMAQMRKELNTSLAEEIKAHTVAVTPTKEGIVVSLRELGFFDSGSIALHPSAMQTLERFVKVVGPMGARVRIEGHTDNIPIHNGRFDSNWELSTSRATEIIKLFISRYGMAPERLSASGYGEYYPVASNATAEGRALNRRVDLVILNSDANSSLPLPQITSGVSAEQP